MGVTYKLKQEVIDFIVQKKQADPSLSCRKLVILLQEAFQLDVSKSSINAVIKEFNLSNPVGRRSEKASKNFSIPSDRKQQLLAQVVPFLPQAATPVDNSMQTTVVEEDVIEKADEVPSQEIPAEVKEETVHLAPDLIAPPLIELKEEIKEQVDWSDAQGVLVENMGLFFVRAFMQDILRRPLLGQVLLRAADMEGRGAKLLEAAVFLKAMGCSSVGDIQGLACQALAVIFEAHPKEIEDLLSEFFGKNLPLRPLSVALETELRTAFVQGAFFKCVADTGRSFYLSADLGELFASADGRSGCSIFKAIEQAVDRLLIGRKPLVFDLPQGLDPVSREFLAFLDGKAKDRFDRIELWSNKSENIWNSLCKVGKEYKFIAKVCSSVERYVCFEKIGDPCFYEDTVLGHGYELEEGLCVIDQEEGLKMRAILVGMRDQEAKSVLLTNILVKNLTKIQVLEEYLDNKGFISSSLHNDEGNGHKSHYFVGNRIEKLEFVNQDSDLDTILGSVFKFFDTYTAGALSAGPAANQGMQHLYPVAARVRYQKNHVHVRFETQKTFVPLAQLQMAIERANCFAIRDYLGRRICFSLAPWVEK